MSGHSKWHNIQKTKGAQDAKRAQAFTKIAREMIVAVKEGGSGDPNNNSRLAAVIAKAKAANMPNDNIKRTIDKALGSGNTDNYESITYEGYGPSGVAIIVETMTVVPSLCSRAVKYFPSARNWPWQGETAPVSTPAQAERRVSPRREEGIKRLRRVTSCPSRSRGCRASYRARGLHRIGRRQARRA